MTPSAEPGRASFADAFRGEYFWITVTTMASVVITSLDNYIVNTSMPVILRDLHDPAFYAWVTSAFILTQVIGLALGGAWRDRAGLRQPFLVSVAIFGIGSLCSGFAPTMPLLVASRALQGLGGGGMSAVSFAASASYPEALRLRMFSLNSTVWGVVSLMGPLAGGLITDHIGWRWIFLVNVPICVAVFLLGIRGYPSTPPEGAQARKLPVVQGILLALTAAFLVGAPSAEWTVAVPLFLAGIVLAVLYVRSERRAAVPVIPLQTWRGRGPVGSSMQAILFFTGAYMGAGVFLPLYLQGVRGETATQASIAVTIPGLSWTLASLAVAQARGEWPKRIVLFGAWLVVAGALFIAFQTSNNWPVPIIIITWAVAAMGIGSATIHLNNWAIVFSPVSQTGAISGAVQTCRMLGSASGAALMGALLTGIGAGPTRLPLAITAVYLLAAAIAFWPATLGRPKGIDRSALPQDQAGVPKGIEAVA